MDDIHLILEQIEKVEKKVMATIIEVEGSFYKKAGSAMLLFENGTKVGMFSSGCMEEDLEHQAAQVRENGKALTIHYDMRSEEEDGWGQGYGCNGIVNILLELIDDKLTADFLKVKNFLDENIPVFMLKKIETEIEYLFVPCEGEPFGWWQGDIPSIDEMEVKSGLIPGTSIFQHLLQPKPRLTVFGAGADAQPLVALAAKIGFSVTVCDWRKALCTKQYFPDASRLVIGFPDKLMNRLSFIHDDLTVIMTHHFERDREILEALLEENVKFIGVLGPRERTERLLRQKKLPLSTYAPIGISIGAVGADEIAVSIVAQLIEICRKPSRKEAVNLWTVPE